MTDSDRPMHPPDTETDSAPTGTPHYYGPHQPGLGVPGDQDRRPGTSGQRPDDPHVDPLAVGG